MLVKLEATMGMVEGANGYVLFFVELQILACFGEFSGKDARLVG